MKKRKILFLVCFIFLLSGCGSKPASQDTLPHNPKMVYSQRIVDMVKSERDIKR